MRNDCIKKIHEELQALSDESLEAILPLIERVKYL